MVVVANAVPYAHRLNEPAVTYEEGEGFVVLKRAAADELLQAREAFLASTTREVQSISVIEQRDLGPVGERTMQAADLLLDRDPWGAAWIAAHRAQQAAGQQGAT